MALTAWAAASAAIKSKGQNVVLWLKGIGQSDVYALEVDASTGAIPVSVSENLLDLVGTGVVHSYASGNVTTATWVELIASTAAQITQLIIGDSGGQVMELGVGAAASEVRILLIPEGGIDVPFNILIAAGSRLSVRAVSATANAGYLVINTLG